MALNHRPLICLLVLAISLMCYAERSSDSASQDSIMKEYFARGVGPYGGTDIKCPGCPMNPGTCGKCCNKAGYKSGGSCGGFMWKNCLCVGKAVKPTEEPIEEPEPDPDEDLEPEDSPMGQNFARGVGPYSGTDIKCPGCPMNPGTCGKCCNKAGYKSGGSCGGFLWKKCLCVGKAVKPTVKPTKRPTEEPTEEPEPDPDDDLEPEDSPMGQNFARGVGPYSGTDIKCPGCPMNPGTCGKCCNKAGYKSGGSCGGFLWKKCLCVGKAVKPTVKPTKRPTEEPTEEPEPDPDEDY